MKNFKKVIASLTSAAMVFGMVSLTPMSSFAAGFTNDGNNMKGMNSSGEIVTADFENDMWAIAPGATVSYDSVVIDNENKAVTMTNLIVTPGEGEYASGELYVLGGSNGYTYIFDGNCSASTIAVEGGSITISATAGSKMSMTLWYASNNSSVSYTEGTTNNYESANPVEEYGFITYRGQISISGPSTDTTSNTDDADDTDGTTGDTTDDTDDATTDGTTSDDTSDDETTTGDTSDDETTTGDSTDNETESPNVIEGKNLSWNTVDATGKSYWYENGVKQGTVDDPKAVSYDGAVRGREIYDPESKEWYWLDADANGARAVNKEVFVPYIYQDQSKLSADEIMALAKLSDGGLDGVGGTVYSAIINKTGKWIRYDAKGAMIKGWYTVEGADAELYPSQKGNTYYYDTKTGTMAKGDCVIDGVRYHFDGLTGALKK